MSAQLAQALRRLIAELPVRVTNDQQLICLSAAHIEGIGQACVKALQAIEAAPQQAQAPTQAEVDLNEALLEVDYWKRIAAHLAAPVGYKLVPIREVQQAQAPGWQDIATAPNDGSLLLLFERYEYEPFIGSWQYGKWTASRTHYDTDGNACVTDRVYSDGVSHWMPLPAAPQQGSNT